MTEGVEEVERGSERAGTFGHDEKSAVVSSLSGAPLCQGCTPMTDLAPKSKPRDIDNGQAIYRGSVVHRKVSVKGTGRIFATVVVTVQQGQVWMSIQPPFTWEAIMEPDKVDELIRTLAVATNSAKKIVRERDVEGLCET